MAQQTSFPELKLALLRGFDLTEEGFRKKFREAKIQKGESYSQFGARLEHYLNKWIELSGTAQDFAEFKNLVLGEQVLSGCGPELTIYLRERKLKTPEELLEAAEVYREARANSRSNNYPQHPRMEEGEAS